MITKFVNREQELAALERRHHGKRFELVPVYGRRRTGKTELILRFLKGKQAVYFQATAGTESENIRRFKTTAHPVVDLQHVAEDWESLFVHIKNTVHSRVVVVIDEFPYLIEANKALSSIFQRIVDLHLKDSSLFLILCGSSVGMMEKEVLFYRAPLYGRRTGQLEIRPLPFAEACRFFHKPFEECLRIYAVCGGSPAYLKEFVEQKPLFELVAEKMLARGSLLREELPFLLREEFRDPKVYLSILTAVSLGRRKLGEIIMYCGFEDKTSITPYLRNLENLGYLKRELPVTESPLSKKGLYTIPDHFFRFWFRAVRKNIDLIEKDREQAKKVIENEFPVHLSFVFEDVCRQFLWSAQPVPFRSLGRWWEKDKEIDIVGLDPDSRNILFAECKWQDEVNPTSILSTLKEKAVSVQWHKGERTETYCIFAKSFSKRIPGCFQYDLSDLEKGFKEVAMLHKKPPAAT